MAEKRDYYEVLGVERDATDDELKRAFRKKAKAHHPDLNPDDETAEAKFKEVNEAYAILSDPEKRQQYDRFGHAAADGQGFNWSQAGGVDFSDILNDLFGGGFGGFGGGFGGFGGRGASAAQQARAPRRGRDLEYRLALDFMEAAFGTEERIQVRRFEVCDHCDGSKAEPGTSVETCSTCQGTGRIQEQSQTIFGIAMTERACHTCHGTGQIIPTPCSVCHGEGRVEKSESIRVKIPAGIDQGNALTVRGKGDAGVNGGPAGDLYVRIQIRPHPVFTRRGNDSYCEVPVTFGEAALGEEIDLPTIDGPEKYRLKEGTQPGATIKLAGKGIPQVNNPQRRGDHYATVKLEVPRNLSEEQKEQIRIFDEGTEPKNYEENTSFFSRLKDLFT